jgi:hypothetical protein
MRIARSIERKASMRPLALCLIALTAFQQGDAGVRKVVRIDHGPIKEASGIVASRQYPGIFWVHNDSGNPPVLYAVRRDGTLVHEFKVSVPNVDWEDIAVDGEGHLYVGDIGNNNNRLALRIIYRIDEPDPSVPPESPLPVLRATYYRFASKEARFDAESLFLLDGRAVVITKRLDGGEAELMAIPLDLSTTLLRPALPERIGKLPGLTDPATGADLSADGELLAVITYSHVFVYQKSGETWRPLAKVKHEVTGAEGVCWDGEDLLVVGESREMAAVPASAWRKVRR